MTTKEAVKRAKQYSEVDTAMLMLTADHVAEQLRQIVAAGPADRHHARLSGLASQLSAGLGRFGLPSESAAEALLDQHAGMLQQPVAMQRMGGAA